MPVLQISDSPLLKPDCVFVIAPDSELVINGDHVSARPFTEPRGRRAPIDMSAPLPPHGATASPSS